MKLNHTILPVLMAMMLAAPLRAEDKTVHVSDITFAAYQGDKVRIRYYIPRPADVEVFFSQDGGKTFMGPLIWVMGDVGKDCQKGRNTIVWDPLAEIGTIDSDEIVFKVVATAHVTPNVGFLCALGGMDLNNAGSSGAFKGTNMSFGAMAGYGGQFGGYVKAKSTFAPVSDKASYTATSNNIWLNASDFEWQTTHMQFTGGLLFRMNWNVFFFGGLGYGIRDVYLKDYNSMMVKTTDLSISGVAVEVGTILRLGGIAASASFAYLLGCPTVDLGVGFFF